MRIKDYIKQAKAITTTPFCGEITEAQAELYPECIIDATFQAVLANYIKDSNGKLNLCDDIIEEYEEIDNRTIEDLIDIIQDVCQTWYIANKYRYETLYQTMLFEYNPIENYNMIEAESGSHSESGSGSNTIGAQSNSHTIGAQSNSHTIGQQTDGMAYGATQKTNNYAQVQLTDIVGQQQNTNAYGQQHKSVDDGDKKHTEIEVDTHGVSAYNETNNLSGAGQNGTDGWGTGTGGYTNFSNESRDVKEHTTLDVTTKALSETDDAHTDTLTLGTHTDTHTTGSREDTEATIAHTDTRTLSSRSDSDSIGQRMDSDSLGARNDSHSDSSQGSNSRSLTRSGNIGVTTTQMMIESQRDVANFNFMKIVCKDIVKKIASLIYD